MEKICKNCLQSKNINLFKNEKRSFDGKTNKCKECINKERKEYRKLYPEIIKRQDKKRRNLLHVKKYKEDYRNSHREELSEKAKERYKKNREYYLLKAKKWREENPEKYKEYLKNWNIKNREWYRNRYNLSLKYDTNWKIKNSLRGSLRKHLNGIRKTNSTLKYLGCSIDFFKGYIESKFRNGMNWKNYGEIWHIDHIIPCRSFNLSNEDNIKKCFHYTNLQPLLVYENLSKQDKMPDGKYARNILS